MRSRRTFLRLATTLGVLLITTSVVLLAQVESARVRVDGMT